MATKVKAELTLDDKASNVLGKIKSEFAETYQSSQAAQQGLSFFEQTLSTMAAVHLPNAIRSAAAFGKELVAAAANGEAFDSSIAALTSTIQGVPFAAAMQMAEQYGDEFDALGIRTGVAIDAIEAGFSRLLEIQGATAEGVSAARQEIEQLTVISRGLNLPLESVSQEFAFMSEGMLKTRGRLFQLLQATGVFGEQTKGLAQAWVQLTEAKRMAILSDGLRLASDRLSKVPPTLNSLLGTLHNLSEVTKERIGEGIASELAPRLQQFIDLVERNSDRLERFSRLIGERAGKWVDAAPDKIERGFQYLDTHSEEIFTSIEGAVQSVEQVVRFMLAHKEELAAIWGAKTVAPLAMAVGRPAGAVAAATYRAGAAGTSVAGFELAGALGGVAAVTSLVAALGALTIATDQLAALYAETQGFKGNEALDLQAKEAALRATLTPRYGAENAAVLAMIDRLEHETIMLAAKQGESAEIYAKLADVARAEQLNAAQAARDIDEFARVLSTTFASAAEEDIARALDAAANLGETFQAAMEVENQGLQQYIANTLVKSKALQDAFLTSSSMTAEGFEALAALVQDQAADFADKLRQKAGFAKDVVKPEVPKIQFNGGQTFKVQQDFRDEDPDRIALVFQRGILSAAERRLQATTSSPFGT